MISQFTFDGREALELCRLTNIDGTARPTDVRLAMLGANGETEERLRVIEELQPGQAVLFANHLNDETWWKEGLVCNLLPEQLTILNDILDHAGVLSPEQERLRDITVAAIYTDMNVPDLPEKAIYFVDSRSSNYHIL